MRTMSLGQSHRRVFQLGLLSVAALALTACSSDSDRISLFGVDRQQPATVIAVQPGQVQLGQVQPGYVQPGTTYQVAPNISAPQVTASGQLLTTPAPYTAPTYTAPGYPQTTASIGQPTYQLSPTVQALPQPVAPQYQVTQPTYQVAQRSRVSAPTAHLAQTPGGFIGAQLPTTRQVQQVQYQQPQVVYTQQPVYQPVYQQPAPQVVQLPAPQPLTTASIGTPQRLMRPDPITTASITPPRATPIQSTPQAMPARLPAAQVAQTSRAAGWSAVGGTRVQMQPGETLFSVSRRYGIPVDVLQRVNNLSDANAVRAGQQITIPVYSTASASPVAAPQNAGVDNTFTGSTPTALSRVPYMRAPAPMPRPSTLARSTRAVAPVVQTAAVVPAQAMPTAGTHVVNSGDTVFSIARRYNMPVQQLIAANAITNPNSIRIGQRLIVASSGSGQALPPVATAPANTQTPAQIVATRGYTPPQPASTPQVVQQTATIQQVAARQDEIAEQTPLQFRWPIRGRVLSGFGTLPNGVRNDGVNIAVPEGASIRAAEEGEIVYAGNELRGFGNLVLVQHRNGYVTAYAHNSRVDVRRGDRVNRGDIIARAGSTGDVDTPQLHFEIRRGTTPVDPSPYLPQG